MSHQKLLQQITGLMLVMLSLVGCVTPTATVVVTAVPVSATPTPTVPPTNTPTVTLTPMPDAIPEGYELDFDQDLQLSFIRPSGWDIDEGSRTLPKSTVLFVAYSRVRSGEYKLINLMMAEQPVRGSPEELIEDVLNLNETKLREAGADILEKLRDVTVDGEPAAGIIYRATDPRGVRFFSILLAISRPKRGYIFQWASSIEYEGELREIYEMMLPTIEFTD